MSWGLICLNCRYYVWNEKLGQPYNSRNFCSCKEVGLVARPSLNGTQEAPPRVVERYWKEYKP